MIRAALGFSLFLATGFQALADDRETKAREDCRHILSPVMLAVHPAFERRIYDRCVELQRNVWYLREAAQ